MIRGQLPFEDWICQSVKSKSGNLIDNTGNADMVLGFEVERESARSVL